MGFQGEENQARRLRFISISMPSSSLVPGFTRARHESPCGPCVSTESISALSKVPLVASAAATFGTFEKCKSAGRRGRRPLQMFVHLRALAREKPFRTFQKCTSSFQLYHIQNPLVNHIHLRLCTINTPATNRSRFADATKMGKIRY